MTAPPAFLIGISLNSYESGRGNRTLRRCEEQNAGNDPFLPPEKGAWFDRWKVNQAAPCPLPQP